MLDGLLDSEHEQALITHLDTCKACAEVCGNTPGQWQAVHKQESRSERLDFSAQSDDGFENGWDRQAIGSTSIKPPEIPGLSEMVEVGHGGMGVVFKAHEVALGRPVAVKVLTMAGQLSPHARMRAIREAQALARLQHSNVVQIHRFGELDGGLPYLVMEWIGGGTLQQQLEQERPTPLMAASILKVLAAAVAEAHARGIIHRDLKPANVLLVPGRQAGSAFIPKLADFGLARPDNDDAGLTESGVTIGTPSYMAPEQTGLSFYQTLGPPTDVHGLGAILYALLTGKPPYQASSSRDSLQLAASGNYPAINAQKEKIPRDLITIMQKCLQADPQRRYRTAQELVDELDRFLTGKPILARPISGPERLYKWALRRPVAAVSALLFASATLAAIFGTAYHIRSMSHAMQKTKDALGQVQSALSTFDDDLIKRLMERGSALDASDRAFLQKVKQLYLDAPLEPDPLTAFKDKGARLQRLGGIFSQISQNADASLCQQSAIDAYDEALKLVPGDLELLRDKGTALVAFHNSLLSTNQAEEAEPVVRRMVELYQKLAAREPFQQINEAKALIKLGVTLDLLNRYEESQEPMAQALKILEQNRLRFTNSEQFWLIQCQSLLNAALSSSNAGRTEEFEARLRTLLKLVGQPIEKFPDKIAQFIEIQSISLTALSGFYVKQNRLLEAEGVVGQLMQVCRDAYRAQPQNHVMRESLGDACGNYYQVCKALGKPREAEADLFAALNRADEAQKAEPAIFDRSRALIYLLEQMADLYQQTDRLTEALAMNERLLECARPWLTIEGYTEEVKGNISGAKERQAKIASILSNEAEAEE